MENQIDTNSLPAVERSFGALPTFIECAGSQASDRVHEFFATKVSNPSTRRAYRRAASSFFSWMEARDLALRTINSEHVAAWVQSLQTDFALSSVNQQLAAVRMLLAQNH